MKCLLIIDVQNGFVSKRTEHILPKLRGLCDVFKGEITIATKFVNADNSPYEVFIDWHRLKRSPEIDVVDFVSSYAQRVFEKNIYSSCTNELISFLEEHKIKEVYLAGIDTDCCVLKTATDLFERGIRPIVLTDYCASNGGEESHRAAIRVMERTIGKKQILYGEFSQ